MAKISRRITKGINPITPKNAKPIIVNARNTAARIESVLEKLILVFRAAIAVLFLSFTIVASNT